MTPFASPTEIDIDATTLERVEEIVDDLRHSTDADGLGSLDRRRDACERASRLADDRPAAALLLGPSLVDLLQAELDRTAGAVPSVDNLLLGGPSRNAQVAALEALLSLSRAGALTLYEEIPEVLDSSLSGSSAASIREHSPDDPSAERLGRTLSGCVTAGTSESVQRLGVAVLGEVYWRDPAAIDSHLRNPGRLAGEVSRLLEDESTDTQAQRASKLLALLCVAGSDDLPAQAVGKALQSALTTDDVTTEAFAVLALTELGMSVEGGCVDWLEDPADSVTALRDYVQPPGPSGGLSENASRMTKSIYAQLSWGPKRSDAVRPLGKVAALAPHYFEDPPRSLVEQVRTLPRSNDPFDYDRWIAANALGEAVATPVGQPIGVPQPLVARIQADQSLDRRIPARALGAVAATHSAAIPDQLDPLVREVRSSEGRDRAAAAEILGLSLATSPEATLRSFAERLRGSSGYPLPGGSEFTRMQLIVDTGLVSPAAFLRLVSPDRDETSAGEVDLRPYLEAIGETPKGFLDLVSEIVSRDASNEEFPLLQRNLRRILTTDDELPADLRVAMVDILSSLNEPPVTGGSWRRS